MMDEGASFSHGGGVRHGDTSAATGKGVYYNSVSIHKVKRENIQTGKVKNVEYLGQKNWSPVITCYRLTKTFYFR